ncbi:MAG: hypothetical protein ACI857_002787 [Arenicella sp.]|jgi:hypothetical protein
MAKRVKELNFVMLPLNRYALLKQMKALLTILVLVPILGFCGGGEIDTFMVSEEFRIGKILTNLRSTEDDTEKELFNIDLQSEIEELLEKDGVMQHPFSSWTTMSTITSPDGAFRIFNWNIESKDLRHTHFCYVVKPKRGKGNQVFKFKEDKVTIGLKPIIMLTPNRWYGALYYKIIPVQKGSKVYYTIMGYSGKDKGSNQKLLDVFYFKGKTLRIGHPMFQESKGSKRLVRRVFFEYSEKAIFTMRENEKLGGIVFDHLVPEQKNLEGIYSMYIPDMTYDAYRLQDGIWRYDEDVIAYNDENKKVKQWHPSEGGDMSEYSEVNDFWIDPVDTGVPGGGTDATAPVVDVRDTDKKAEKKQKKLDRKNNNRRKFKPFKRKKKNRSAIGAD